MYDLIFLTSSVFKRNIATQKKGDRNYWILFCLGRAWMTFSAKMLKKYWKPVLSFSVLSPPQSEYRFKGNIYKKEKKNYFSFFVP